MKKVSLFWTIVALALGGWPSSAAAGSAFENAIGKFRNFAADSGANVDADPEQIVGNIINTVVGVLGVIAVGLVVYAGGLWITAAGRDEQVEKAKQILKTTIIGIVILGLAYAIVLFITSFVAF